MNNLVVAENGRAITNSLLVAEKFEKNHRDVLEVINNLLSRAENSAVSSMFVKSSYIASNGKENPMYIMNRDGFSLLVMGFTGTKALAFKLEFIEAFNKMEQYIRTGGFQIPQNFADALRLAAEQAEKVEEQRRQIEAMRPKEIFTDAVVGSASSCLVGELAKILRQNGIEIGEKRLFQWLRDQGYLGRCGERYNIPMQQYIEQGLFELKKGVRSGSGGVMHTTITPKITAKGQVYFVNKFMNRQFA